MSGENPWPLNIMYDHNRGKHFQDAGLLRVERVE